jgi:hypothetical protein
MTLAKPFLVPPLRFRLAVLRFGADLSRRNMANLLYVA